MCLLKFIFFIKSRHWPKLLTTNVTFLRFDDYYLYSFHFGSDLDFWFNLDFLKSLGLACLGTGTLLTKKEVSLTLYSVMNLYHRQLVWNALHFFPWRSTILINVLILWRKKLQKTYRISSWEEDNLGMWHLWLKSFTKNVTFLSFDNYYLYSFHISMLIGLSQMSHS